ncbi:phage portal protein [Rhodovulum marinum]|uniref:HK97 family phage portal protein n=1 Tax=Rhodovulum marinum TaxID=320662 RepID=A0A4R2QAM0_9RHOB|nr:phage portal protein [Rhodovulum marinum]TCP43941.1 HK97 family phage portal protein [Rhodovulum marinum]
MGLKNLFRRAPATRAAEAEAELRAAVQFDPGFEGLLRIIGAEGASEHVSFNEAISLPPVFAAINFLSSSLAALPVAVYRRRGPGEPDERVDHPVAALLNVAANDTTPAIELRQVAHAEQFGPGRGYIYIERDRTGLPINLFPLEYDRTAVRRDGRGRVFFDYTRADGRVVTYPAADVIDLAFSRRADLISSRNPVLTCAGAIRQGLNASRYALTVFGKNGIPPYVLEGAMPSGDAARRASDDVAKVARRQAEEGKPILPIPAGFKLTRLGDDPEKMQLTPVQIFTVQQVARIYNLPPVFLQELSTGTFANTEQQDLHLVKHTLSKRARQSDAELSLKLFGRDSDLYVRSDLDELAKGVFKDRIEALARAVQTGQLTPNEAREMSGREALDGGGQLFMQSATIPITLIEDKIRAEIARGVSSPQPPEDTEE